MSSAPPKGLASPYADRWRTAPPLALFLVFALIVACSPKRAELTGPLKHYAFQGEILSLNPKAQTASINAAAIPNYMEAMTMEYPITSKAEFNTLHVGDKVTATLDVSAAGDDYALSNIRKLTTSK